MMGAGDFFGGLAAQRSPVALVGLIGQAIGLIVVLGIILFGAQVFAYTPFVIGMGAGACGSVALMSLYRGLAVGRVAIVAPLSAVLGALLPVLVSILTGHTFGPLKWGGIVSGLVAVYFLSLPSKGDDNAPKETGVIHAIIAGISLAAFYMLLGSEEAHGSIWTLLGERSSVVSIMVIALLVRRQSFVPQDKEALKLILAAGACDILGNLAFLYSATRGPLPMVALLTSLYPAMTIFLGWILLKEPLNRKLIVGIIFAFACIALFATP